MLERLHPPSWLGNTLDSLGKNTRSCCGKGRQGWELDSELDELDLPLNGLLRIEEKIDDNNDDVMDG